MKKIIMYTVLFLFGMFSAYAATGDYVATTEFETKCPSGIGVGVAFDGENLWYSCYGSNPDLYRADPLTGNVTATYNIDSGIGALSYDATRNGIWVGYDDCTKEMFFIQLDDNKDVVSSTFQFIPDIGGLCLMDGLAYDAEDDTLYMSADVDVYLYQTQLNGSIIRSFLKAPSSECGSSGLAIGGALLYEGFNGCNHIIVVDKTDPSSEQFDFSTAQAEDPSFRDEDLECDTTTFANEGLHVMWSVEAYDTNFGANYGERRALAFEIPYGTCGEGGQEVPPGNEIPEFGVVAAGIALVGALGVFVFVRKQ